MISDDESFAARMTVATRILWAEVRDDTFPADVVALAEHLAGCPHHDGAEFIRRLLTFGAARALN